MNFEHIVVLCSCPDAAAAQRIAHALVTEGLAACVNRIAAVRSTYAWKGGVEDEPEVLLMIKTTARRYPELELRLAALHPYELPEIIALPIVAGSSAYLAWLAAGSGGAADPSLIRPSGPQDAQDPPT
jgi:periplasmic divalent cation tolerance protein